MKPLPEAVQRAFPREDCDLPDRPWWRRDATGDGVFSYRRVDGKVAYEPSPRNIMSAEGVDADYPLPHPGYRAGQVWAAEDGESVVISAARRNEVRIFGEVMGRRIFAVYYPYLMADPACPHLAPWSPVEEKKP